MTPRDVLSLPAHLRPWGLFGYEVNLERFLNRLPPVDEVTVAGWGITELFIAKGGRTAAEATRMLGEIAGSHGAPDLAAKRLATAIRLAQALDDGGEDVIRRAQGVLDRAGPRASADRRRGWAPLANGTPGRAGFVYAGQSLLRGHAAAFAAARVAAATAEARRLPSLEPSPSASLAANRDLIDGAAELLPAVMAMPSVAEMAAFISDVRHRMPRRTRHSEHFPDPPTLERLGALADDREQARTRDRRFREQFWHGETKPPADPYAATGGADRARTDLATFTRALRLLQALRSPEPRPLSPTRRSVVLPG